MLKCPKCARQCRSRMQVSFHLRLDHANDRRSCSCSASRTLSKRAVRTGAGRQEWGRAEPSGAERSRLEPSGAEGAERSRASRAEPSGAEWSRAEPSGAERSRAEPSGAERSRVEPSGASGAEQSCHRAIWRLRLRNAKRSPSRVACGGRVGVVYFRRVACAHFRPF